MSRLDEVIAVTESDYFLCNSSHYARDLMLIEIAISLAVIADAVEEQKAEKEGSE